MKRRAFTLLETMMATGIASVVVLACVMIMYTMNRTDYSMEVRAEQRFALGRIRTVMERAFSSLLMSDEPRPGPTSDVDNLAGGQLNQRINAPRTTPAARASSAAGKSDAGSDQATDGTDAREAARRQPKPPPPPRIILGPDTAKNRTILYPMPGGELVETNPQRLEVVLHRSPIPEAVIDPMDMPLPPRRQRQREREQRRSEQEESGPRIARPVTEEEPDEAALPVRAVRGAFELYPQPPRGYRPPGIPTQPAVLDGSFEPTGLWELWWIPLRPPGLDPESMTGNEYLFSGLARPYFIAGDLKYVRWTAFYESSKRQELLSTWTGDLPAYIEMQVETAAGLKANWMFEVDWAVGPEVARREEETPPGRGSNTATTTTTTTSGESPVTRRGGARPTPTPSPSRPAAPARPGTGRGPDRKGGGK